ncbi:MAG: hypothetical protein ACOYXR_13940 [Nitrospirota bacterium]
MRRPALGAALGLIVIAMASPAWAGPWTVAEGEAVVSMTYIQTEFDRFYNVDRERRTLPGPIRHRDAVLTLTYGFIEDWDAAIQVSRYDAERLFPGNEAAQSGLGDSRFGIKHLVYHGAIDVAAQAGIKLAGRYDADVIHSPGDGQTDFEARVLGGKFWDRAFVDLEAAYRLRLGPVSDEYEILLDAGYAITSWLHGRLFSRLVDARTGVGSTDDPNVELRLTEEDTLSLGGAISLRLLSGLELTLQYTTVVAGRNTPIRPDLGVSVAYSFDFFL